MDMDMDLISSLPDGILCDILSLMSSTKEAASTSVLSKRWRNLLFTFTSNEIRVDDQECRDPNYYTQSRKETFRDFVDRSLAAASGGSYSSRPPPPIRKFALKQKKSFDEDCVNRWICNLLSRGGVEDLDLLLFRAKRYSLPSAILSCDTIVNLKLGIGFRIDMLPEKASLPSLKTLFLNQINVSSTFEALISACHVLEELTLHVIDCKHWRGSHTVSSPTLKRLVILCDYCRTCNLLRSISFDTPNLSYLEYQDSVADNYPVVNFPSLVEAKITLKLRETPLRRYSLRDNPVNFIKGLKNVHILQVSSYDTSLMFDIFREAIPAFIKLRRLSVATHYSHLCSPSLKLFIRKSPYLRTLILNGPFHFSRMGFEPRCVCSEECYFLESSGVEVLEITEFKGTCSQLMQMTLILKKLRHLKLVKVCFDKIDQKRQSELTSALPRLPRPSKGDVKFEFSSSFNPVGL